MSNEEEAQKFKDMMDRAALAKTDAQNAWVAIHVIYGQMREAGFTENQACRIVGAWMANSV